MIVLIVGDFGVGKDTVANLFLKNDFIDYSGFEFQKIKSYTTRPKRYDSEDTHIFCTKEEFSSLNDIVAQTQINNECYGARKCQFDKDKINLYCVDDKGVRDIEYSNIDKVFVVEVIRPSWLIDLPEDRLNRSRQSQHYKYIPDYIIMNDGGLDILERTVSECFNFMKKFL